MTDSSFSYRLYTETGPYDTDLDYVLDYDKQKHIDFAILLGKPLLVEGEAGCGKTRLAYAIAHKLLGEQPRLATIRSTSRAVDLLYRYDAVRRLQESQLQNPELVEKAASAYRYVSLQDLGRSIFEPQPSVVLIDEIDKADPDFANDLLHVIDQFAFQIDEIPDVEREASKTFQGFDRNVIGEGARPIIIFTSNRERPLPKPFLRRCIYLELTFPTDPSDLAEIVQKNLRLERSGVDHPARGSDLSVQIIDAAVASFLEIRKAAEDRKAIKLPATAELIDWVHVLHWEGTSPDAIKTGDPPHWRILFSTARDIADYERSISSGKE
ncbi:MAG: MoxR family ATPase [Pseudomonadota bacterium]